MSQPTNIFVAGAIIQTILQVFFLGHRVISKSFSTPLATIFDFAGGAALLAVRSTPLADELVLPSLDPAPTPAKLG